MSSALQTVGVIGAGSFGTTVATLLANNGREVLLYARSENTVNEVNTRHRNERFFGDISLNPNIRATSSLEEVCERCSLIFPIVPAKSFREVTAAMSRYLRADHVLVHGTKGIERDTFKTMSSVILEETCVRLIGAIAGPNLAKEIMGGKPAATVIGSRFDSVVHLVADALRTPGFMVYGNRDILGVELGGALKNILAIGAGIVDGAELGDNAKAFMITRGLSEMGRLGIHMGAEVQTFSGLSGIGDIMATCASPLSRNYQVGYRLGKGEKLQSILDTMTQVAEGVTTTEAAYQYAEKHGLFMNITRGLYRLLYEGATIPEIRHDLMTIPTMYEVDRSFTR